MEEEFFLLKRKITKREGRMLGGECILRMVQWRILCSEWEAGRGVRLRAQESRGLGNRCVWSNDGRELEVSRWSHEGRIFPANGSYL